MEEGRFGGPRFTRVRKGGVAGSSKSLDQPGLEELPDRISDAL